MWYQPKFTPQDHMGWLVPEPKKRGPKPGTTWKTGPTAKEVWYNALHGAVRAIVAKEMMIEQIIDRNNMKLSATFARVNKRTLTPKQLAWRGFMRATFEEWQRKQRLIEGVYRRR